MEKINEKDVRLLRYAVEQTFDGAMRDGALSLIDRLVDATSEAAKLEGEIVKLREESEHWREKRGDRKRERNNRDTIRKMRRTMRDMADGKVKGADGKPILLGETLFGEDGRPWRIIGAGQKGWYEIYGLHVGEDGAEEIKPLKAEWLTHEPREAEKEQ